MTRTARRGGSKRLPLSATPWATLKKKFISRYHALQDEDIELGTDEVTPAAPEESMECDVIVEDTSKARRRSDLRETHRSKLSGSSVKKFFQKIKHRISGKKLRRQLRRAEMTPLLDESSEPSDANNKKTANKSSSSQDDRTPLLSPAAANTDEDDSEGGLDEDSSSSEDKATTSCGLIRGRGRKHGKNKQPFSEKKEIVRMEDKKRMKNIEARRLRRQKKKVCFNCRQSGHLVHECPHSEAGICFKCGAANHTSKMCKVKVAEGEYPYAKCFICGEIGHLSKTCPDNPRGIYPRGGGCKVCGSVEHLKANCPVKLGRESKPKCSEWGSLVITNHSADAEDFDDIMDSSSFQSSPATHHKKHKVVKF